MLPGCWLIQGHANLVPDLVQLLVCSVPAAAWAPAANIDDARPINWPPSQAYDDITRCWWSEPWL